MYTHKFQDFVNAQLILDEYSVSVRDLVRCNIDGDQYREIIQRLQEEAPSVKNSLVYQPRVKSNSKDESDMQMTTEQNYNRVLEQSKHQYIELYKINNWRVFKRDCEIESKLLVDYVAYRGSRDVPFYSNFGKDAYRFETENSLLVFCSAQNSINSKIVYRFGEVIYNGDFQKDVVVCPYKEKDPILKLVIQDASNYNCEIYKAPNNRRYVRTTKEVSQGNLLILKS